MQRTIVREVLMREAVLPLPKGTTDSNQ